MLNFLKTIFGLLLVLSLFSAFAFADETPPPIDMARAFPVQKNPIIVHSQKVEKANNADSNEDAKKPNPQATKLNLDSNGRSSNRSAGGKAMLKQKIPFD